jgi:A/G-specific adenine glycosylase
MPTGWTPLDAEVVHVFTHFRLTLRVCAHHAPKGFRKPADHIWLHPRDFAASALPSVMQKIWKSVLL